VNCHSPIDDEWTRQRSEEQRRRLEAADADAARSARVLVIAVLAAFVLMGCVTGCVAWGCE